MPCFNGPIPIILCTPNMGSLFANFFAKVIPFELVNCFVGDLVNEVTDY